MTEAINISHTVKNITYEPISEFEVAGRNQSVQGIYDGGIDSCFGYAFTGIL